MRAAPRQAAGRSEMARAKSSRGGLERRRIDRARAAGGSIRVFRVVGNQHGDSQDAECHSPTASTVAANTRKDMAATQYRTAATVGGTRDVSPPSAGRRG